MVYLGRDAASGVCKAFISQMLPHDTYIETLLASVKLSPSCCSVSIKRLKHV